MIVAKKLHPEKGGIEKFIESIGSVPSLVIHTGLFLSFFSLALFGVLTWDFMLLVLTTILSLEAIYLAIFIQITVNRHSQSLRDVEENIDEIQEDVEELGEDLEDIQEDIEEISEDIEEISEDIDEIQEDVEELNEEEDESGIASAPAKKTKTNERKKTEAEILEKIAKDMATIMKELEALKK